MRYKSPAKVGYRDNKTYETLQSQSNYSTADPRNSGIEGPNFTSSDDSFDRLANKRHKHSKSKRMREDHVSQPITTVGNLPQQTLGYCNPVRPPNEIINNSETLGVTIV